MFHVSSAAKIIDGEVKNATLTIFMTWIHGEKIKMLTNDNFIKDSESEKKNEIFSEKWWRVLSFVWPKSPGKNKSGNVKGAIFYRKLTNFG